MGGARGDGRHWQALQLFHPAKHVEKNKDAHPENEGDGQQ
jgi:hypothetical protein